MRAAILACAILAASACAQLDIVDDVTFTQERGNTTNKVRAVTFRCTASNEGSETMQIYDPVSRTTDDVTRHCAPPVHKYTFVAQGTAPAEAYTLSARACRANAFVGEADTATQRAGGTLGRRQGRNAVIRRAIKQMKPALRTVRSMSLAGFGHSWACTVTGEQMSSCGNKELVNAMRKLKVVVGDLTAGALAQERVNIKQAVFNSDINSEVNANTQIAQRLLEDNIRAATETANLAGSVSDLTNLLHGLAETQIDDSRANRAAIGDLADETDELKNVTNSLALRFEIALQRVFSMISQLSAQQSDVAHAVIAGDNHDPARTSLTYLYYNSSDAFDTLVVSPPRPPTVSYETGTGRRPPTESELNLQQRVLSGAKLAASVSVQGTVRLDGIDRATEIDIEMYCDPHFMMYNLRTAATYIDLHAAIGGNYADGTSCLSAPPGGSDGSRPGWNCNCYVSVKSTSCRLSNNDDMFPWTWPSSANGIDLSRNAENAGEGDDGTYCTGGFADPTTSRYRGVDTTPLGVSVPVVDASVEEICRTPEGTGEWLPYTSPNGTVSRLRVQRRRYNTALDMELDVVADPDVCNPKIGSFNQLVSDADALSNRLSYVLWHYMQEDWRFGQATRLSQIHAEVFGSLPDSVTTSLKPFSTDTDGNYTNLNCDELTWTRLGKTGNIDEDIVTIMKPVASHAPIGTGSWVTVRNVDTDETSPVVTAQTHETTDTPMPGASTRTFRVAASASVSELQQQLLPNGDSLYVNSPVEWATSGVIHDVPTRALSVSTDSNGRAFTSTLIFEPYVANLTEPLVKSYDNLYSLEWFYDEYNRDYDARQSRGGTGVYRRDFDSSSLRCGQDADGEIPLDNPICALLAAYTVTVTGGSGTGLVSVEFSPRADYTVLLTVELPQGTLITNAATSCPGVGVTYNDGTGESDIVLYGVADVPVTVCVVVVGAATQAALVTDDACDVDYGGIVIPANGEVDLTVVPGTAGVCNRQWIQVYELPADRAACPPAVTLRAIDAVECFPDTPGLGVQTTRAGLGGNNHRSSATAAVVDHYANVQGANMIAIADANADRQLEIAAAAAELYAGVEADRALATEIANRYYNRTRLPGLGSAAFLRDNEGTFDQIQADINRTLVDITQRRRAQNATSDLILANLLRENKTAEDLAALNVEVAGYSAAIANLTNDTRALFDAIDDFIASQDEIGGGLGFLDDIFDAFGLGGFGGIMDFIIGLVVLVVMVWGVFTLGKCCIAANARRSANRQFRLAANPPPQQQQQPYMPPQQRDRLIERRGGGGGGSQAGMRALPGEGGNGQ